MTHTFKKLIFPILLLVTANSYAQTHTYKAGWCRYAKQTKGDVKGEVASFQCKACDKEKQKEEEVKNTESKKRADVATANYKAKKAADKKDADLKKAEDAKNAHSGEVLINGTKTATSKISTTKKVEPKKTENHYFYSISPTSLYYLNSMAEVSYQEQGFIVNGDSIFTKKEFKKCAGLPLRNNTDFKNELNFPPNIGIVILKEEKIITIKYSSGRTVEKKMFISDLVDIKGNRLINDDEITFIIHFVDDYFILFKGDVSSGTYYRFDDAAIYNYKTKQSHQLRKYNKYINVALSANSPRLLYSIDKDKLKNKGEYKAFFATDMALKKYVVYYITNDGKIEEQEIN